MTDAVVGVVAVVALGGVLRSSPPLTSGRGRSLRRAFGAFFGSVAVASFAGAALHGLFRDPASGGRRVLWKVSLGAIGASAAAGLDAAAALALHGTPTVVARAIAAAVLAAWLVVVAVATVPYRAVVALYAPVLAVFGGALASRLRHAPGPACRRRRPRRPRTDGRRCDHPGDRGPARPGRAQHALPRGPGDRSGRAGACRDGVDPAFERLSRAPTPRLSGIRSRVPAS
ncbi:MAG TPA: hypothetical protein VFR14_00150 [Candidatus Limnocylindrales bacterium]|nr:hypothetical protein [Candidatus Limnocylindrales bacterium]